MTVRGALGMYRAEVAGKHGFVEDGNGEYPFIFFLVRMA